MTDQSLDGLLRQVLLDADSQEYGDMMELLPEHDFSPGFERRMKKLIRRADHPMRYRVAQVAACLLLAALLNGCTVLAISPEAREAFVGWVQEIYESGFVYRFSHDTQEKADLGQFRPTWLPDGYSQSLVPELGDQVNVLYSDSEGHTMLFLYANSSAMLYIFPEQEPLELIHVTVNGIPADFYLDSDDTKANWLVWAHPENDLIFAIGGNLPQDTMVRIAESVKAVQ